MVCPCGVSVWRVHVWSVRCVRVACDMFVWCIHVLCPFDYTWSQTKRYGCDPWSYYARCTGTGLAMLRHANYASGFGKLCCLKYSWYEIVCVRQLLCQLAIELPQTLAMMSLYECTNTYRDGFSSSAANSYEVETSINSGDTLCHVDVTAGVLVLDRPQPASGANGGRQFV